MLLATATPVTFIVAYILTLSIHSSQHSEWSEEGQDDYRIAPDSEEFRLALAGCLAMTLAFICNWILDVIHYFKSTDHTNTVQLGLNQISMRTQFIILLALIVPCSLLFIYPHRTMFWVLTHIQTHTLLQIGYHYIQRVFCQDGGSWEMLLFPCLLFTAGIAHYLSVLEGGSMHTALITITAASSLVAILVILGLGKSIYKQLLTNMKESGQLIPEEQQALRFVFVLSSWLLAYAISMLVISGNYMVDFCLVHTIFVGILGFALSMCNSVKSKQAALLAENALETKRIFVRHVSHEIRTPLNTTILGLRLLDQELNTVNENRDETLLHDLVSDIDSSCAIAVDMLNDLLLYEKIEGGLVSLETTDVPVWDSMKEVLKVFRIQAKSLQIQLEYPDTCVDGYHIKVDKYKLSQVFRNLVSNALKFTSTNGTVKVQAQILSSPATERSTRRSSRTSIRPYGLVQSVFPSKGVVRISVTDSGVGISKEDQKRLFREIVQFDAAKLQKGQGSGLGLWISSRIVRLHGGKIGVLSEGNGTGSTFYVDLPISKFYQPHPLDDDITNSLKESFAELFAASDSTHTNITRSSINSVNSISIRNNSSRSTASVKSHGSKTRRSLQSEVDAIKECVEEDLSDSASKPFRLGDRGRESSDHSCGFSSSSNNVSPFSANRKQTSDSAEANPSSPIIRNSEQYVVFYNKRILIVDDAPTNRKIVNRLLKDKIAHRDEACNGVEAVAKCSESMQAHIPYDIVILDYFMPELDGPDAAKQMRALGFRGVIVGVTGNNYATDIARFKECGADDVLVKPLDADVFWRLISEHMSRATTPPVPNSPPSAPTGSSSPETPPTPPEGPNQV